jgi:hypothetical protein
MPHSPATIAARLSAAATSRQPGDCNCPEAPLTASAGPTLQLKSPSQMLAEMSASLTADAPTSRPIASSEPELFDVLTRYLEANPSLKSITITLSR